MPPPKLTSQDVRALRAHCRDLAQLAKLIRKDAVVGSDARILTMSTRVLLVVAARITDISLAHGMAGLGIELEDPQHIPPPPHN